MDHCSGHHLINQLGSTLISCDQVVDIFPILVGSVHTNMELLPTCKIKIGIQNFLIYCPLHRLTTHLSAENGAQSLMLMGYVSHASSNITSLPTRSSNHR